MVVYSEAAPPFSNADHSTLSFRRFQTAVPTPANPVLSSSSVAGSGTDAVVPTTATVSPGRIRMSSKATLNEPIWFPSTETVNTVGTLSKLIIKLPSGELSILPRKAVADELITTVDDGVKNVKVNASENVFPEKAAGSPLNVNDPRLMVEANTVRLEVLVSTVTIALGKLVPLKVKPNSVGLELNVDESKAPKVIP